MTPSDRSGTAASSASSASSASDAPVVIIGAGPAGLTAAHELVAHLPVLVLEQNGRVGGLAQTVEHDGFRFDIGGHRFFTKIRLVQDFWRSTLGTDLLRRPRLSRIYYRGRFFSYPLRPLDALTNLGLGTSVAVAASYLWSLLFPIRPERSFADWVSNRFGRRLFEIFFKTYTEKVWGIPCERIDADWAAQRIKGLSLGSAALNMLWPGRNRTRRIKTLIDEFEYPRLGPGMMWEAVRARVEAAGGTVVLHSRTVALHHADRRVKAVEVEHDGARRRQAARHVIATMPLRDLVHGLTPPAPTEVLDAASRLKYRDFITVALIVDQARVFDDNWIYVHDAAVQVGRIQNFKNWSPDMVPDASKTCLGLEYFCFEDDDLWSMPDAELVALGSRELVATGLVQPDRILRGVVVRMPKAYPVYDTGYQEALDVVRSYVDEFENLQPVGRNGMHKYNNQDHSMLMAILAVRNVLGARHDLWAVNSDDEYQEELRIDERGPAATLVQDARHLRETQPLVPRERPPD